VESKVRERLAGNCNDREEAAAGRHCRLAIVARRLRCRAIIVVLMGATVSMDVKLAAMFRLAAVIVNADMSFGQAMRDGGIVGKRKRDRRRKNAKCVEHGNNGRRFDTKSLGQGRQHLAVRALNSGKPCFPRIEH